MKLTDLELDVSNLIKDGWYDGEVHCYVQNGRLKIMSLTILHKVGLGFQVSNTEFISSNEKHEELLAKPLKETGLSARVLNVLKLECIGNIGDLILCSSQLLSKQPNLGNKSVKEIIKMLERYDLKLASDANWDTLDKIREKNLEKFTNEFK